MRGVQWLNDDLFGELDADPQADIANLANDVGVLGEQADFLFFAEAHFPEAVLHFGRGGELFYPDGSACANVT